MLGVEGVDVLARDGAGDERVAVEVVGARAGEEAALGVGVELAGEGRLGGRAAEDAVARDGDAVGLEHAVDDLAVEEEVLLGDVVDADGLAQRDVRLGLVEREARAVEADEEVDNRPLLGAPLEDVPLGEEHEHDVLAAPQAVQDREHRLRPQLRLHAADPQRDDHGAELSSPLLVLPVASALCTRAFHSKRGRGGRKKWGRRKKEVKHKSNWTQKQTVGAKSVMGWTENETKTTNNEPFWFCTFFVCLSVCLSVGLHTVFCASALRVCACVCVQVSGADPPLLSLPTSPAAMSSDTPAMVCHPPQHRLRIHMHTHVPLC